MRLRDDLRLARTAAFVAAGSLAAAAVPAAAQLPPVPPVPAPAPVPALPEPALPPPPALPAPPAVPVAPASAPLPASVQTPTTAAPAVSEPVPAAAAPSTAVPEPFSGSRPAQRSTARRPSARPVRGPSARRGVELTFTLARPGRVVVVVRGPLPSCDEARRFTVRGRRGANTLRFYGRRLDGGTYVLALRTSRGARAGRVAVQVVEHGAVPVPRAREGAVFAACAAATSALSTDPAHDAVLAGTAAPEREPAAPPSARGSGVAGDVEPDEPFRVVLPELGSTDVDELSLAALGVVLALLLASVVGITLFLVRFFRPGSSL